MKLYLFTRIDDMNWDEYAGAVVAAPTETIAKKLMFELCQDCDNIWKCILISENAIDQIKQGVVLDSYIAVLRPAIWDVFSDGSRRMQIIRFSFELFCLLFVGIL